jgi:putative nucleotidyltransferase with HDIG domain
VGSFGTTAPDADPTIQRLMAEARANRAHVLPTRELIDSLLSVGFLVAAIVLALALPRHTSLDPALAVGLVAAFALSARVEFNTGPGWTTPTQLIFVPMLFLLPLPDVPLFVLAAFLLARAPDYLSGTINVRRALSVPADAWYAVGPVLVLAVAGTTGPDWGDWPIYLAALWGQFCFDLASTSLRACFGLRVPQRVVIQEMGSIFLVDALLAPIGLLAVFGAVGHGWRFLMVLPLVGLIAIFAREREGRIKNALTLSDAYRGTALLLGEVLSSNDEYTGAHSRSVVVLAHQVGEVMGVSETVLREIEFGALLHDVGKMSVPNEIINKPGALTDEEWAVMRRHAAEGERMLTQIGGVLAEVGTVIRSHHEHFDGTGYPDGLSGEDIPLAARVISCCDAFNAMTTDRSYRRALGTSTAIEELRANAGTQFDPQVVEALVKIADGWDGPQPGATEDSRELAPAV